MDDQHGWSQIWYTRCRFKISRIHGKRMIIINVKRPFEWRGEIQSSPDPNFNFTRTRAFATFVYLKVSSWYWPKGCQPLKLSWRDRKCIFSGGGRKGLRWCGFALFLVRFCGNFYFNSRYCGFKTLSGLRLLQPLSRGFRWKKKCLRW